MDGIEQAIATDAVYLGVRPSVVPAEKPIICKIKLNPGGFKGGMNKVLYCCITQNDPNKSAVAIG